MCSSLLPGPLPLGDGSKPFGFCVLFPTKTLCGIRVLSLPSGPGSHCQSVSVSVKGTLSCLHGLGKQAYLGVSVSNQRQLPGPHLTLGPALCALSGRRVEATRNSLQSRRCDRCPGPRQRLMNACLMESAPYLICH